MPANLHVARRRRCAVEGFQFLQLLRLRQQTSRACQTNA
jgi:hypothetical protein